MSWCLHYLSISDDLFSLNSWILSKVAQKPWMENTIRDMFATLVNVTDGCGPTKSSKQSKLSSRVDPSHGQEGNQRFFHKFCACRIINDSLPTRQPDKLETVLQKEHRGKQWNLLHKELNFRSIENHTRNQWFAWTNELSWYSFPTNKRTSTFASWLKIIIFSLISDRPSFVVLFFVRWKLLCVAKCNSWCWRRRRRTRRRASH